MLSRIIPKMELSNTDLQLTILSLLKHLFTIKFHEHSSKSLQNIVNFWKHIYKANFFLKSTGSRLPATQQFSTLPPLPLPPVLLSGLSPLWYYVSFLWILLDFLDFVSFLESFGFWNPHSLGRAIFVNRIRTHLIHGTMLARSLMLRKADPCMMLTLSLLCSWDRPTVHLMNSEI